MNAPGADPVSPDQPLAPVEKYWALMHKYLVSTVRQSSQHPPLDIYFLGDSITAFWPSVAAGLWQEEFGKWHVINCGIAGDITQNILYRIANGEFDRIAPRVIVLLAGINNLRHEVGLAPLQLATGVKSIVQTLRAKSPTSKILLLGIFPVGDATDPLRPRIKATNELLAGLADDGHIAYLDPGPTFLDADGNLPLSFAADGVHPSAVGYRQWADAMRPTLLKLLEAE